MRVHYLYQTSLPVSVARSPAWFDVQMSVPDLGLSIWWWMRLPTMTHCQNLSVPLVIYQRHCKKRVKVKEKTVWRKPCYVKLASHKDPFTGRLIKTKGGTQIIDRVWRFLKERITLNQNATVGSPLLPCQDQKCSVRVLAQEQ